jgi:hypothetical protein
MSPRSWQSIGISGRACGQTVLSGPALALYRRLDALFLALAHVWQALKFRFPPFIPVEELQRADYFRSFPHLATFPVSLARDDSMLAGFAETSVDTDGSVELPATMPVRHAFAPAACYHVYVEFAGRKLIDPVFATTCAACCRQEERFRPLERQWTFSMREIVCLGADAEVKEFLSAARVRISRLLAALDLPAEWRPATDPFFRPRANPKHLYQSLAAAKSELVFADRLAIASINAHGQFFGRAFDITGAEGPLASGCVAFGLERWIAAFLERFGAEPADWPSLETVDD